MRRRAFDQRLLLLQHGSYGAARALGLDSGVLKRRLDAAAGVQPQSRRPEPIRPATFVELRPSGAVRERECVVEIEDSDGAAIGAMARAFLEGRRA